MRHELFKSSAKDCIGVPDDAVSSEAKAIAERIWRDFYVCTRRDLMKNKKKFFREMERAAFELIEDMEHRIEDDAYNNRLVFGAIWFYCIGLLHFNLRNGQIKDKPLRRKFNKAKASIQLIRVMSTAPILPSIVFIDVCRYEGLEYGQSILALMKLWPHDILSKDKWSAYLNLTKLPEDFGFHDSENIGNSPFYPEPVIVDLCQWGWDYMFSRINMNREIRAQDGGDGYIFDI